MLLTILSKADDTRLLKATQGLCTGAYHCTITWRSAEELQGMVWNGQGTVYHVSVWDGWIVCSCPDSRHRTAVCTHAIALVLYAVRYPKNLWQGGGEQACSAASPYADRRETALRTTSRWPGRFPFGLKILHELWRALKGT